jgi:hypothetical protein
MEKKPKTIALVEIGGSHDECMHTQIEALKLASCRIVVVTTSAVLERNPHWKKEADFIELISFTGNKWLDFQRMRQLNQFFKNQRISAVVLNTAQGGHIRNLCLTAPKSIPFYGIIHTIRKFEGSFTQQLISLKIKNYLVLSDFLLEKIRTPKGIHIQSFYPIFYPSFETEIQKPTHEIWIVIAGGVEERRKDLTGFLTLLSAVKNQPITFIFLGKSNRDKPELAEFYSLIEKDKLENKLVLFDEFVSDATFDGYVKQADFLLPLIHPNTRSAEQYITKQISGMFNLSYSYKIPMLMHNAYQSISDLKKSTFFYEPESFEIDLKPALEKRFEKVKQITDEPKWKVEFQMRRFLEFIGV